MKGPVTKTYVEMDDLTDAQAALFANKKKGFDLRTRIIDPKTGKVLREQPYSMVCSRDLGEDYFIRDGKRYNRNGVEIGAQAPAAQPVQPQIKK